MTKHAFTLFELLVTVTIIAILVAMLLPLVGRVRSSAQELVCINNLRQLGQMEMSYASTHSGMVPPAFLRDNQDWLGGGWTQISGVHGSGPYGSCWDSWINYLTQDMGFAFRNQWNQGASFFNYLTCPNARFAAPKGDNEALHNHWFSTNSYGPNTAILGNNPSNGANQWGYPNQNQSVTGWPGYGVGLPGFNDNRRRISSVPNPGNVILLAEHRGANHWFNGGTENPFAYWTEAPFIRAPIDENGNQMIPPASWGTWLPAYNWTTGPGVNVTMRVSHRGRSNYLFHDGRVAAMSPWDTCTPDPTVPNMWTGNSP